MMRALLTASLAVTCASMAACSPSPAKGTAVPPPKPPASTCVDLAKLPVCSPDHWCWVDPLPQGNSLVAVHGLAWNDAWVAAGSLLHWNGANLAPAYTDPNLIFDAVFEAAPDDIWAAGTRPNGLVGIDGAIVRLRGGSAQTLGNQGATKIVGTGPSDIWFLGRSSASHWDGTKLTDFPLPDPGQGFALGGTSIATSGGSTWVSVQITGSTSGFGRELLQFSGGAWTTSQQGSADTVFAVGANDLWLTLNNQVGRLGTPLLTSDQLLDSFVGIGGTSDTDLFFIGSHDLAAAPTLLRWDGTMLNRIAYPGASLPESIFIGGADWGWIGDQTGELLARSGDSFVPVTPPPIPRIQVPAIWGSGPNDIYVVGTVSVGAPQPMPQGLMEHWDGCRWSVLDPGLGPLGPFNAVWGTGSEVWIAGANTPLQSDTGFLLHKDATGWKQIAPPDNGVYTSVWGTGTNDVWFGGPTFMHWDGASFTTVPPPAGLPPLPSITSMTGTATDDIWAVQKETPDTLYHYDGHAWTQQMTGAATAGFDEVFAVARDDVWGAGFGGIYRFDGKTWNLAQSLGEDVFSIWANRADDVWFGQTLHWDGTAFRTVQGVADGEALWGDGTRVWAAGGGIQVH